MDRHRCDWMVDEAPFGMMVHWIAPGPAPERGERITDLDRAVDAFNLERFLQQFEESGAGWLIFTIGQNSGFYASPSATLDALAGPGHCSRRDLVLELAQGVKALGKRFIAYLPAEVNAPTVLHEPFAWNPEDQSEFQRRYTAFIREYAERFGELLDGWWYDGCYTWPVFHNSLYDWPLWGSASRAGNLNAALAFNDGSFCIGITRPLSDEQDYLSGEVEELVDGRIRLGREDNARLYLPDSRFAEGTRCQWHALVPIDCFWGHHTPGPMDPPKYDDDVLLRFLSCCREVQGVVTLNVGIYQEGHIAGATLRQLQALHRALR
ncbi:MAG: hypothetical protein HPY44_13660 [Armatimonadetes bacterium]|nr:hypothetical protein [Armatimonadota bacterium]